MFKLISRCLASGHTILVSPVPIRALKFGIAGSREYLETSSNAGIVRILMLLRGKWTVLNAGHPISRSKLRKCPSQLVHLIVQPVWTIFCYIAIIKVKDIGVDSEINGTEENFGVTWNQTQVAAPAQPHSYQSTPLNNEYC